MTDLEITKLCAEAMGFITMKTVWDSREQPGRDGYLAFHGSTSIGWYDPLHDDSQVMGLVKRFWLLLSQQAGPDRAEWIVNDPVVASTSVNFDLNRAICECVAKMQAAKARVAA